MLWALVIGWPITAFANLLIPEISAQTLGAGMSPCRRSQEFCQWARTESQVTA